MAIQEKPTMLGHDIVRDGVLSASSETLPFNPVERIADGIRYTSWLAATAADQEIGIKVANMLLNGDFEDSAGGWTLTQGSTTSTFARQTTEIFDGVASAEIDTTAWTSGRAKIESTQRMTFEAGKTYRLAFAARAANATAKSVVVSIIGHDDSVLATKTLAITNASWTGSFVDYVVGVTEKRGAYIRFESVDEINTVYLDNIWVAELRTVDAFALDSGGNISTSNLILEHRDHETDTWEQIEKATVDFTLIADNEDALFHRFDAVTTLFWRLRATSNTTPPEITQFKLGGAYDLPRHPTSFDPDAEETDATETETESGVQRTLVNFSRRDFNIALENLSIAQAATFKQFWLDIGKGAHPFVWLWLPTTEPRNVDFVKYKQGRRILEMPFEGVFRSAQIDGEEVKGQRR